MSVEELRALIVKWATEDRMSMDDLDRLTRRRFGKPFDRLLRLELIALVKELGK